MKSLLFIFNLFKRQIRLSSHVTLAGRDVKHTIDI